MSAQVNRNQIQSGILSGQAGQMLALQWLGLLKRIPCQDMHRQMWQGEDLSEISPGCQQDEVRCRDGQEERHGRGESILNPLEVDLVFVLFSGTSLCPRCSLWWETNKIDSLQLSGWIRNWGCMSQTLCTQAADCFIEISWPRWWRLQTLLRGFPLAFSSDFAAFKDHHGHILFTSLRCCAPVWCKWWSSHKQQACESL